MNHDSTPYNISHVSAFFAWSVYKGLSEPCEVCLRNPSKEEPLYIDRETGDKI